MRSIQHPGQTHPTRVQAIGVRLEPFDVMLQSGMSLMAALASQMSRLNAQSAAFSISGGAFEPFSYVMPALSKTPQHAVYFSDIHAVEGAVQIETASVTFGQREGKPWLHSHALWVEASGRRHCGHLLPDDIQVSVPIRARGVTVQGAVFTVCPDAETNFSLFVPVQKGLTAKPEVEHVGVPRGYAIRVAPNVDICNALEQFCMDHNISKALIHGGVGSTIGVVFEDGRVVEPFSTEILIRRGEIFTNDKGEMQAQLDVSLVDYKGGVSEGRFARGRNAVLVTFELVLEVIESGA